MRAQVIVNIFVARLSAVQYKLVKSLLENAHTTLEGLAEISVLCTNSLIENFNFHG